jgi:DNA sulfur modification protein DndC
MADTAIRTVPELIAEISLLSAEIQELYLKGDPIVVGWSGGKDSTALLQLIWYAILNLPTKDRIYDIFVVTNDTLVENPIVSAQVRNALKQMEVTGREQGMPIKTFVTTPEIKDTFWVSLIGKGYGAPRRNFRWCTDRLKIRPAATAIREWIRTCGQVVLALGTRSAESTTRAANMAKHRESRVSKHLNPNPANYNSFIYTPIEDWRTDEVWLYLMQFDNPWGCNNKDLFAMYRGATADNECPLVVDTTTPSCGSSRFGCWTCTLVSKDKSMEAMILNDSQKEWMQPLLDIRNELDEPNDRYRRDFRRLAGRVDTFDKKGEDGTTFIEQIPGPYLKVWREHWLRRVLEAQTHVRKTAPPEMRDITLITQEELSEIRRIWLEEKHEFDDSLPQIYEEATGETFEDSRPTGRKLLGNDEWEVLKEVCEGEASANLELMAKLLDTERQYYQKIRRTGIYKDLANHFETSSLSRDDMIAAAHQKHKLKKAIEAVGQGSISEFETLRSLLEEDIYDRQNILDVAEAPIPDLEELKQSLTQDIKQEKETKQLSWANIKFPGK